MTPQEESNTYWAVRDEWEFGGEREEEGTEPVAVALYNPTKQQPYSYSFRITSFFPNIATYPLYSTITRLYQGKAANPYPRDTLNIPSQA